MALRAALAGFLFCALIQVCRADVGVLVPEDGESTSPGGSKGSSSAHKCHPVHSVCDEVFFVWLVAHYEQGAGPADLAVRHSYGYLDFKVFCALEAAIKAAKYSRTRVVVYSEIPRTSQYLRAHGIEDVVVRHLTSQYMEDLFSGTPLEAWYTEYRAHPPHLLRERRLHLSNALRLAILYHKGGLWLDMDAIVLRDDTLDVLPNCMGMQSHICYGPNGGAIRIVGANNQVIWDHMAQYPITYKEIVSQKPQVDAHGRTKLRGLAGVLTRTQSLVYGSYKRDRKIQLGGGPETRPGTWEHVSCAFLAAPENGTNENFYFLPMQTMYPLGIGSALKRATQHGDRKGAAIQWRFWKETGVFINHYWSKKASGGLFISDTSFWGLMMTDRCPRVFEAARQNGTYQTDAGFASDPSSVFVSDQEFDERVLELCTRCQTESTSERNLTLATKYADENLCGWTCCPEPPCWGKYEPPKVESEEATRYNLARYFTYKDIRKKYKFTEDEVKRLLHIT